MGDINLRNHCDSLKFGEVIEDAVTRYKSNIYLETGTDTLLLGSVQLLEDGYRVIPASCLYSCFSNKDMAIAHLRNTYEMCNGDDEGRSKLIADFCEGQEDG